MIYSKIVATVIKLRNAKLGDCNIHLWELQGTLGLYVKFMGAGGRTH